MKEIELLSRLYTLYMDDRLASLWDEEIGDLENDPELDEIMAEVYEFLPEELTGEEASQRMREMPAEVLDKAIEDAGDKVIDMRKIFRQKMSQNGGALGLTGNLVEALNSGDSDKFSETIALMKQLVEEHNKGEEEVG